MTNPCGCITTAVLLRGLLEGVELPSCEAHPAPVLRTSSAVPLNAPTSDIARLLGVAFDDLPPVA